MDTIKVTIKSLSDQIIPYNREKCGTLIQNLYSIINKSEYGCNNISLNVLKHDHHKATILVSFITMTDYLHFKEIFYRLYADSFMWREKKWHVK